MARSIGDTTAHSVGVIAIPEVLEMELSEYAEFMLIASDGVWEFMSNEDVVTLIEKELSISPKNYSKACRAVVQAATELWNKNDEDATDDISCILCSFT